MAASGSGSSFGHPAWALPPPSPRSRPSRMLTTPPTSPLTLFKPDPTPSSNPTYNRSSSTAARCLSKISPGEEAQLASPAIKHKGSAAKATAAPTTTSNNAVSPVCAETALSPACVPAFTLLPPHPCDKPNISAQVPSSIPASHPGTTHVPRKDVVSSNSPHRLQTPSCSHVALSAGCDTQNGPGEEPHKGDSTTSAALPPASIDSSTTAAKATAPTPACLADDAEVTVSLTHEGGVSQGCFPASTTLGEAVRQWAQLTGTSVAAIKLRHASDDEYLSQDYWWSPLSQIRLVADSVLLLDVVLNKTNLVRSRTVIQSAMLSDMRATTKVLCWLCVCSCRCARVRLFTITSGRSMLSATRQIWSRGDHQ